MLKRLFALLVILIPVLAIVAGRKRSQTSSGVSSDFQHPDRVGCDSIQAPEPALLPLACAVEYFG